MTGLLLIVLALLVAATRPVRAAGPTYVHGSITVPTTWTPVDSPYIVTDTLTVELSGELTIQAGVTVQFITGTQLLISSGPLLVQGTLADPVLFTACDECVPTPGIWDGISFNSTSAASTFNYAIVEYAGTGVSIADSDDHVINHCTFRHNGDGGDLSSGGAITSEGDWLNVLNNEIHDNELGLRLRKSFYDTIAGNRIYDNDAFGVGFVVEGGPGGGNNAISNNEIYGNGGDGVHMDDGYNNQITENEIHGNGGNGIWLRSQASIQVADNIVRGNALDGLAYDTPNFLPATIDSNIFCSNGAFQIENTWATSIQAEGNWFGTNSPGPAEVSGTVDYDPWIQIDLSLVPDQLPADGASTATFTARMVDGLGHAVPDGYQLDVSTNEGSLSATTLTLNNGQASTTYTAGTTPGPVAFTVTDGCGVFDFPAELTLQAVDLAIDKTGPGGVTWPGELVTYTIEISELNGVDAVDTVITDDLPAGTTWFSDTGASCGLSRQSTAPDLIWTADLWPGGTSCQFEVTVQVGGDACQSATLVNTVEVTSAATDDDLSNNSDTTTTDSPAIHCIDLAVHKDDGAGLVPVLSPQKAYLISYTLTYTNEGFVDASGVVLSDDLPAGSHFYAGSGWTCAAGTCTYDLDPLPVGASGTAPLLVVEVLTDTLSGCPDLENVASISDDGSNGPDFDPADNTFSLITALPCQPDLRIDKTDNLTDCIYMNELVTYTISYANVGLADASGVVLTDILPEHTAYVGGGWACDAGTCTYDLGSLAKGASSSVELVLEVIEPVLEEIVTNTVRIDSTEADLDLRDNETLDTTDICPSLVDLQVTKSEDGLIVGPNKDYFVEYTIVITNAGLTEATGVRVTDTLPTQATYAGSGWTCPGPTCHRAVGTLVPSDTVELTLQLRLDKSQLECPIVLENRVAVGDDGSHGGDLDPADNVYTLTSTFECLPDLVVVVNDNVGTPPAGDWLPELLDLLPPDPDQRQCVYPSESITYTVAYVNAGLVTATQVVLTEFVPQYTSYQGVDWNCSGLTCTRPVGSLAPNEGGVAHFVVRVETSPPDLVVEDEVRIDGAEEDLHPPDNVSYETTPICEGIFLRLSKDDNRPCAFPGDEIRYTITFTNPSDTAATGVVLTESLPAHTLYLTTAGWTPLGGGHFVYDYGLLPAYSTGSVEFVVIVENPLPPEVTETINVVCLGYDGPNPPDNCFSLVTPLPDEPDLRVVKHDHVGPPPDPGVQQQLDRIYRLLYDRPYEPPAAGRQWEPVHPGDVYSYTITYLNMGRQPATGVVLTETLPEHTTYVGYGWTYLGGRTYVYEVGDLGPGMGSQRNFWVKAGAVPCDGEDYLYNWVHIGGDQEECNTNNNWSGEETPVECRAYVIYLPIIVKGYVGEPPTPTPSPSPTALPTPTPTPTPSGAYVSDVAVNPETERVYVTSPRLDAVFAVDPGGAGSVIATIPVGDHPLGLGVVTTTNKIYAANFHSWTVTAIRGSDHSPLTDVYVGAQACKIATDSGAGRVYATNHLEIHNGAAAINSQTDTFLHYYSRLHATQGRYGIDVDPRTDTLFIAARDAGLIAIQDANAPDAEPLLIKLDPPRVPFVVAFNRATDHLFVTAADDNGLQSRVVVLDPYNIQLDRGRWIEWRGRPVFVLERRNAGWIGEFGVGLGAEEGIAVNPRTGYVYVTNGGSDTVTILRDDADPANIGWIKDLPVGQMPQGVAVDVKTDQIYVGNAESRDLSVIDGATQAVVKTIPLD